MPQLDGQPPAQRYRAPLSGPIQAMSSNEVASGCTTIAKPNTTRNTG